MEQFSFIIAIILGTILVGIFNSKKGTIYESNK